MLQGLKIWRGELYVGPKIWGGGQKSGAYSYPLPTCLLNNIKGKFFSEGTVEMLKHHLTNLIFSWNFYFLYTPQGRRKVWKSGRALSTVVGIICPPGWDRVKFSSKKLRGGGTWYFHISPAPSKKNVPLLSNIKTKRKIAPNWYGLLRKPEL